MSKELLNHTDEFRNDNNELNRYLNAKAKLDTIFNKITNYRSLYLYDTSEKTGITLDFDDVFNAALGTCLKLDAVTQDKHIAKDHQIFYIHHNGKIFRGVCVNNGYKELRLAKIFDGEIIIDSIEIDGYISYNIERLGGEL